MENKIKIKRLLTAAIIVIPILLLSFYDKLVNGSNYSVTGLFFIYLPLTIVVLLIILYVSHTFLKQKISDFSPRSYDLIMDTAIVFFLLAASGFINIAVQFALEGVLPPKQPDEQAISLLQSVFANPLTGVAFLVPFIWITQTFIIGSRIFLLKNCLDYSDSKVWIWSVILLSSILFVLPEADRHLIDITVSFIVILIYNITYYYYPRLFPLIFASILAQTIQLLDFWITYPG